MTKKLRIYTDGGARGNPGPGAIGVVICDSKDNKLAVHCEKIGISTNNIAEYTALIKGLEMATGKAKEVECFLDSELVVKQVNLEYKIKKPHLLQLFLKLKKGEKAFDKVTYSHLPRSHRMIAQADLLVNKALDNK